MFKSKAFAVSVSRTAISFLPIFLAPLCLGTSYILLEFYKLQLGLSIIAAIGSMGLGAYIYKLALGGKLSYADRIELAYLITIFKITSILFFLIFISAAFFLYLFFGSINYFKYAFLVPFTYLFIEQQIQLAKQNYLKAIYSFIAPPLVFCVILVVTYAVGDKFFNEICLFILIFFTSIIFYEIKPKKLVNHLSNVWKRLQKHLLSSKLNIQISNGLMLYICPPVATLILIEWLENLLFEPPMIAAYYLYSRAIDSFIAFLITYFAAGHMQDFVTQQKISIKLRVVLFYSAILLTFYFTLNFVVNFLTNYMSFLMLSIEMATGLLKFCLAIMTLFYIRMAPNIIGFKELLIVIFIYLLTLYFIPSNIYYFQFSVLVIFALILCALILLLRPIKLSGISP
jgi:hypothetical protein